VFKGSADVVQALIDAGVDPDLGSPSARESAAFFGKDEMAALFDQR
jgi:hypothetical protein